MYFSVRSHVQKRALAVDRLAAVILLESYLDSFDL